MANNEIMAKSDNQSQQLNENEFQKNDFNFIRENDRSHLLRLHYTTKLPNGDIKRLPCSRLCFSDSNQMLVLHCRGALMVFDLLFKKQWKRLLPQRLNVIQFYPNNKQQIIAGTKDGRILTISLESQSFAINEDELYESIKHISFSSLSNKENLQQLEFILAATDSKALLIDSKTLKTLKCFEHYDNYVNIKQINFIPSCNTTELEEQQIFVRLSDDSIVIWTNLLNISDTTIESSSNTFLPLKMKQEYLQTHKAIELNLNTKSNSNDEYEQMIKTITNDYSSGQLEYIAFSNDATKMCISTIDGYLMLFNIIDAAVKWKLTKIYQLTCNSSIRKCLFLCPTTSSSFTLACVTSNSDIILIRHLTKQPLMTFILQESLTKHIVLSSNSKMLGAILRNGECLIFNLSDALMKFTDTSLERPANQNLIPPKNLVKMLKLTENISRNRLERILTEFNEYPTKYRKIIWEILLDLPRNTKEFGLIVEKGLHECTKDYEQRYPLANLSEMRKLKCICSFLAHWCKVFSICDYLPELVYPFIHIVADTSPRLCFELLATLVINHWQLWFEFAPELPINYLAMIENLLGHYEPKLLHFYINHQITTKTYAWQMLSTAFSNVLSSIEWCQLWDHIIMRPSSFLIFCVVAYNSHHKSNIMQLETSADIERFFNEESLIDMRKFIQRSNNMMEKCPENLNPSVYMNDFQPLNKGLYQKFLNYPEKEMKQRFERDRRRSIQRSFNSALYNIERNKLNLHENRDDGENSNFKNNNRKAFENTSKNVRQEIIKNRRQSKKFG